MRDLFEPEPDARFATEGKYIYENGVVREEHDLLTWATWFEVADRTVAFTKITSQVYVSTVFLGIDHARPSILYKEQKREPVLFETMVFGGVNDGLCRRYTTPEQAKKGHKEIASQVWWEEPWWWTRLYRWLFPLPKGKEDAEGD